MSRLIFLKFKTPITRVNIPDGIITHPIASITAESKNLMNVTPATKRVKAVLMYERKVLSLASAVRFAARWSRNISVCLLSAGFSFIAKFYHGMTISGSSVLTYLKNSGMESIIRPAITANE